MKNKNAAVRKKRSRLFTFALVLLLSLLTLSACGFSNGNTPSSVADKVIEVSGAKTTLRIVSGSENKILEPILERFSKEKKINLHMDYMGSLDIMRLLEQDSVPYDAVWPASSLWVSVGDTKHRVKDLTSTSVTPVIFGIKKSLAQDLGFIDKEVFVKDILEAIRSKKLRFTMTSATQSNSGASAYIGFLHALLDNPNQLNAEDLDKATLKADLKDLLSGVERSSGSSDWLKDLFLQGDYDAMVNYEALIISANESLIKEGKEPLYAIYPVDGLTIADSPLGFLAANGIEGRDEDRQKQAFDELLNYLLSSEVQDAIQKTGRRTGYTGVKAENAAVFNKDWGIDTERVISTFNMPKAEVLFKALNLYQSELKKPGLNVYLLDFSGSMYGEGNRQLIAALEQFMLQENASRNFLQASDTEKNIFIPFSTSILAKYEAVSPTELEALFPTIKELKPDAGTAIYGTAIEALSIVEAEDLSYYSPAIILMTDGQNNGSANIRDFERAYTSAQLDVPVFTILFGDADENEMKKLANLSRARVFDGRKDLIDAFRTVRGYN